MAMIDVWYSVRMIDTSRKTIHKLFKNEKAQNNFEKDLNVRGLKITGKIAKTIPNENSEQ